jgi:glucosamine kinase
MSRKKEYAIIGIDGGGTRTRGILKKGDKILAEATAGSTRIGAVGVGESCERLLTMIEDLCIQAGIESSEVDATVIGLAGVWLADEKLRSQNLIKTLARGQDFILNDVIVTSDAELALEGAFNGGPGIVMIVGTGSIAIGKTKKGEIVRCGGWGIELDDEGSGAWIGREGLPAIVRALDGRGPKTKLTDMFVEINPTINLKEPRTIVKAYAERAFEYHMLSPMVMKCAEKKDKVCLDIVNRAAKHLVEHLTAMKKYFTTKTVNVALMGGIIDSNTLLAKKIKTEIKKKKIYKLVDANGSALVGATSLALEYIKKQS